MDLTFFNPHSQSEADFLANFVARRATLDYFLRQLRLLDSGQPARHHLNVAPRGYGKTSLLRRIAVAVRTEADLHKRFIALSFREEQHNVISLDVFWRNCLQSLLEAREDETANEAEIEELDAAWTRHAPRQALKREDQDGEPAWHEFQTICKRLQRRPLLLIDNLDALLAGLATNHQWALRRILQRADGPVLIAAASRYPESTHDPNAAFYEFFRVQTLDKLDDQEVMQCLRMLAGHRGDAGRGVLTLLDKDPGRVTALNTLAGGNPRTLNVLYAVLESHISADLLSQLSAMLDTFTGWYQARTEELPIQARAVFDALALNWDPMQAAALGEITGLDTSVVSSHLSRLEKQGYVETIALTSSGRGRNGYQVSERFFNIWYLMRNGPRRARQSIKFLTVFLQSCFSLAERRTMAHGLLDEGRSDPGHALALASSLRNSPLRQRLVEYAEAQSNRIGKIEEYSAANQEMRKNDLSERDQRQPATFAESAQTPAMLARAEQAIEDYDDVVERFGAATEPALREQVARALVNKGVTLEQLGHVEKAESAFRQAAALEAGDFGGRIWLLLGDLLLDKKGDPSGAVTAYETGLAAESAPENQAMLHAACAYALALHDGDLVRALDHARQALADGTSVATAGRHLLEALSSLRDPPDTRWQHLFERVGKVVQSEDAQLWADHLADLQRLLCFIVAKGKGDALRRWMDEAQYATRYAPLYHALVAAIDGEDHLLQINPEVRQPAARIHEGIARRLKICERER